MNHKEQKKQKQQSCSAAALCQRSVQFTKSIFIKYIRHSQRSQKKTTTMTTTVLPAVRLHKRNLGYVIEGLRVWFRAANTLTPCRAMPIQNLQVGDRQTDVMQDDFKCCVALVAHISVKWRWISTLNSRIPDFCTTHEPTRNLNKSAKISCLFNPNSFLISVVVQK